MILHAIAFDFNCQFSFSKALIQYGDFEFVFHNGGEKKVDVIETLLKTSNDHERFAQMAINYCLGIAQLNKACSFNYVTEFIIGGIDSEENIFDKDPAIQISRRSKSLIVDITNIGNLITEEQSLASSMYNDSQNTSNPFFKFLCYWKILEIPLNSKSRKANNWINNIFNTNIHIIKSNDKLSQKYKSGVNFWRLF